MAKHKKTSSRTTRKKLRIGYISDAFCEHPFKDFLPAFFAARDTARFEATGYADCPQDEITEMFRDAADGWREVASCTPTEIARRIEDDRIDILVNLSFSRTPARIAEVLRLHPAPVQMGMREGEGIDLRIRDVHQAGGNGEPWLPRLAWCYTPFRKDMNYEVHPPCLQDSRIAFGAMGEIAGMDPKELQGVMEAWAGILGSLPDAHLLLPEDMHRAFLASGFRERLSAAGIEEGRIELVSAPAVPFAFVDIALALPELEAGALCGACRHGIPVVVLRQPGNSFFRSLWHELGMPQLYAVTEKDCRDAAVQLARDRNALLEAHQMLRWKLASAMDPEAYMIALEDVYDHAWAGHALFSKPEALAKEIRKAEQKKDWAAAVRGIAELAVQGDLPPEFCMTAAWGYSFLGNTPRIAHWARLAMKAGAPHPMTQRFLLAKALSSMKQDEASLEVCQDAFRLADAGEPMNPDIAETLLLLQASIAFRLGMQETADLYWRAHEAASDFEYRCQTYSSWLFSFNREEVREEELYRKHRGYEDLFQGIARFSHHGKRRRNHSKIRVAYISPDFRAHVMSQFCWPFLATYDREQFEVYVYSIGKTDQYTEKFKTLVDCWRDVHEKSYEKVAALIYRDQVDILFDLAGHTNASGLPVLAWKPAPVQISGLGYMATTGLSAVDYFLTDSFVDPPGVNDRLFVERLLRVRSQFCYTGPVNLPASQGAPAKERGWILFASFNRYHKLTDEMLALWNRILQRTPGSRLLIKALPSERMAFSAHRRLQQLGFDMSRVLFEPETLDYMERYLDVDIVLDTYPYPGGGTTCDALYMGVPVITRCSSRHSTRFSSGILSAVGLSELAVGTPEAYVERAVGLAHDMELLDLLHKNLRSMMQASPLMDPEGYIREVEAHYREIWKNYSEWSEVQDG